MILSMHVRAVSVMMLMRMVMAVVVVMMAMMMMMMLVKGKHGHALHRALLVGLQHVFVVGNVAALS